MSLYREHRGIEIAVHAHRTKHKRWIPRVLLSEETVGETRELELKSPLREGFESEDEALSAGMQYAIDAVDALHAAAPQSPV